MLWTQSGISFAIWVAYGFALWRRFSAQTAPRKRSLAAGPLLLVLGVAFLAAGFYLIEALGGIGPSGLSPAGWAAVTLVGIAFVHCQTLAAAMMAAFVQEHVTSPHPPASSKQEPEAKP